MHQSYNSGCVYIVALHLQLNLRKTLCRMAADNHAVPGQVKCALMERALSQYLIFRLIGLRQGPAHVCAYRIKCQYILIGPYTATRRYAKVTGISCFKSLSLPIFCLGYFETTASTFFVPNPGIPERRIVAVAIAPPLIERNWRRVVRQLVRHSLSLFSILSIKIHLPFFWSKATMSPFYANTVGLLHTVYFFGCQSA